MAFQMKKMYIPSTLVDVMKECLNTKGAKIKVEKDGDKITYFCLNIPRYDLLPYWAKQHLKNGWANGLSQFHYTNDDSCIYFRLHENSISMIDALAGIEKPQIEKYYTSAVHGFYYAYDDVKTLLQQFIPK